jgi:regulator of ribonuclease activity A
MLEDWFCTADLFDRFLADPAAIEVLGPGFASFGGRQKYCGEIATCSGEALSLRDLLSEPGRGRVLVADAGADRRWAVLGDQLGALSVANGWAGVVLNGHVRDSVILRTLDLGVHALGTIASRPRQFNAAQRNIVLAFGDARFVPGSWLYADQDGIVVCAERQRP